MTRMEATASRPHDVWYCKAQPNRPMPMQLHPSAGSRSACRRYSGFQMPRLKRAATNSGRRSAKAWPYAKASARPTQCENWTTEKGKGQQSTGAACRGKRGRLRGTERVLEGREAVATGGDGLCRHTGVSEFMATEKPKLNSVKMPSIRLTGVAAILKGTRAMRASSPTDLRGVMRVPGRKVAMRLAMKPAGSGVLVAPGLRSQVVSSTSRKVRRVETPVTMAMNQKAYCRLPVPCTTKAHSEGPAEVPKSKKKWNMVKARPRWCRKNMSISMRGPRTPTAVPKKLAKPRDAMKMLNWSGLVMYDGTGPSP